MTRFVSIFAFFFSRKKAILMKKHQTQQSTNEKPDV